MQALFQSPQHLYEKREGSGSVPLTNGSGSPTLLECPIYSSFYLKQFKKNITFGDTVFFLLAFDDTNIRILIRNGTLWKVSVISGTFQTQDLKGKRKTWERKKYYQESDEIWKINWAGRSALTINEPLILKMRDIFFFFRANYIMGHFKGYFEGARGTILGSKKSRPPRNIPRNGLLCSLPKTKKIISQIFKISDALVFLCPFITFWETIFLNSPIFTYIAERFNVTIGNPAKYPSLTKNPPKYTTAYTVQQSNCRWLCDPTCFSS